MSAEIGLIDIGLRDVDATESLLWNKHGFQPINKARRRGVKIDEGHVVFAVYHGATVARAFRCRVRKQDASEGWVIFGGIGLNLSSHGAGVFTLGVEAACLIELLSTRGSKGEVLAVPFWTEAHALCVCHMGWRGAFAEYRLWVALYWWLTPEAIEAPVVEATLPMIRGWFSEAVLRDLVTCVGAPKIMELLAVVADHQYAGAPDLCLWCADGAIEFHEVKSSQDALRPEQSNMLRALARIAPTAVIVTAELTRAVEKRCRPESDGEETP